MTARPPGAELPPEQVLARAHSNFALGIVCLPAERRAGMTAIYAFCRVVDDAVDDAPDAATARAHLAFWRGELAAAAAGRAGTPVGAALQRVMQRFGLGPAPLEALLEGVEQDIEPRGFATEAELHRYCWCVASAVGRASLPVLGAAGPAAERFADALGQALQRTNILRDLRADAAGGRCYVPRAWLDELGIDRAWLASDGPPGVHGAGGAVARLTARLAATARAEFAAAAVALRELPRAARRALVPARIMGAIYANLLGRLERRGGALGGGRVSVPKAHKVWLALLVAAGVRR